MRYATLILLPWWIACSVRATTPLQAVEPPLTTTRVASMLDRPLYVTHAPGDFDRLFIVEQGGLIKILDLTNGSILAVPFLDLTNKVFCCGERGLLGLAFHPDYASNGRFYVYYTDSSGDTIVAKYLVSANPDLADGNSEEIVLTIAQPFPNHNAGWIEFGPNDGYLYIATGDGGGNGDPNNRGQTTVNNLLGKILRIDVNGGPPFAIPADNPFVGAAGDDEIWAYGLRNPWRCSFDTVTGDLYIADVGEEAIEEINFQPAAGGGENYGWRCWEGNQCFDAACCNNPGFTAPVYTYDHDAPFFSCSITGGEVYRGCAIPELAGSYFFADFCSNQIWSFRFNGSVIDFQNRTAQLAPGGGFNIVSISSFGRDAFGELYLCDFLDGEVFKIIRDTPTPANDCNANNREDACDILAGSSTDVNGDGRPDECIGPVPTLSHWGLLTLAVLLMVAGSVLVKRRRSAMMS